MPTDIEAEGYAKAWGVEAYTRSKDLDMTIREQQRREGDWICSRSWTRSSAIHPSGHENPQSASEVDSLFLDRPHSRRPHVGPVQTRLSLLLLLVRVLLRVLERPLATRYRKRSRTIPRLVHRFGGAEYDEQKRALSMIGGNQWRDAGNYMREHCNSTAATLVEDACWHCSWCFDKMESYVDKMKSHSHTEHNNPQS